MTTTYTSEKTRATSVICPACRPKKHLKRMLPSLFAVGGLLLVIGGAGGADSVPFYQTLLTMVLGLSLMLLGEKKACKKQKRRSANRRF